MNRLILFLLSSLVFALPLLGAARPMMPNPDFTMGESMPDGAEQDYALGATGARGWMHSHNLSTTQARQIYITEVAKGSPAADILKIGDVLLGVAGKPFSYDPREEMGRAITAAEATGKLTLTRWRTSKTEEVTIPLPILGSYSATAPYNCPKSMLIAEKMTEALVDRMKDSDYAKMNAISRSLNGLGLLASKSSKKYRSILKNEAQWAADFSAGGFNAWYYGYVSVFLAEYIMATGDSSVLPGLRRIVLEAANGQSVVGSWGHRFAGPDGRLYGYGMMNSPGEVMTLGLVLARKAGVKDPALDKAIDLSTKLLSFYIGKGSIPYGDHAPFMVCHEDNGKCGMAAVLFEQVDNQEGAKFFSKMSIASHGAERDTGHTGNYFNMTWAMPGVSRGGPNATGAWMKEFGAWYYDLHRSWDWNFIFPGPPSSKISSYKGWDMSGIILIAYSMPEKAIYLTGKSPSGFPDLTPEEASQVVSDGRGFGVYGSVNAYNDLPPDLLFDQLSSWSPIVRERASVALARFDELSPEPLILLLESPSVETRLGACRALAELKQRATPAVPKLREMLKSEPMWLRVQAANALSAIGDPAMEAVPELLQMIIKGPSEKDPRGMEQRFLSQILFNGKNGMLRNSFETVDQDALLAAVKAGLQNQDGATRGTFASLFAKYSIDQLRPILPAIHQAIVERPPSGIMFDSQAQMAGLDLFSRYGVSQGIELAANYIRVQKKHSSDSRVPKLLESIERYGAHAQRVIPELEKTADYFENNEGDFPKPISLKKAALVRDAIARIKKSKNKPKLIDLKL